MMAYVITKTRSKKSAEKTKKFFESRGVPVNIRPIDATRFLIVTSRDYVDQVHHIRVAMR